MLTAGESRTPRADGAGRVLGLIRDGEAVTRADLARRTGLARSTVAQRVEALLAHQFVYEAGGTASTGGRPPTVLAFNRGAGVVLVADLGATHSRLAVSDLAGAPLAERAYDTDIARRRRRSWAGSTSASRSCWRGRARRRRRARHRHRRSRAGRVLARGAVAPPMMPGWDGFSIPGWFARHYDAPVLVDNDVNIMALGEHWTHWRDCEHLLYVKIGTGIGCGIISGRRDPPRRAGRGRRHRARAARRPRRRRLPLREHRLPRGGRRRPRARRAADRRRAGGRDVARRRPARPRGRAAGDRRPCATPAAASARCWPSASTSSTRARSCIGGDLCRGPPAVAGGRARGRLRPLAADGHARPAARLLATRRPRRRDRRRDHGRSSTCSPPRPSTARSRLDERRRATDAQPSHSRLLLSRSGKALPVCRVDSTELSAISHTKPAASSALLPSMADC